MKNKIIDNLLRTEDLYQLKVGDMCVEMVYSEKNKSFNECMLKILEQKVKRG